MNKYCFFIACLLIVFNINAQNDKLDVMLDSIQRLRKLSKKESLDLDTRLKYAKQASELSSKVDIDSISIKCNESLSDPYWDMKLYNEYRDLNKKTCYYL